MAIKSVKNCFHKPKIPPFYQIYCHLLRFENTLHHFRITHPIHPFTLQLPTLITSPPSIRAPSASVDTSRSHSSSTSCSLTATTAYIGTTGGETEEDTRDLRHTARARLRSAEECVFDGWPLSLSLSPEP